MDKKSVNIEKNEDRSELADKVSDKKKVKLKEESIKSIIKEIKII